MLLALWNHSCGTTFTYKTRWNYAMFHKKQRNILNSSPKVKTSKRDSSMHKTRWRTVYRFFSEIWWLQLLSKNPSFPCVRIVKCKIRGAIGFSTQNIQNFPHTLKYTQSTEKCEEMFLISLQKQNTRKSSFWHVTDPSEFQNSN